MFRSFRAALVCGAICLATTSPTFAGVHVQSRAGGGDPNGLSTTQPGMLTFDFNNESTLATVFKHGTTRSPLGDTSTYAAVGPTTLPLFNASFGVSNYFGLYWGSIDAWNVIEFSRNGVLLARFTGSDIVAHANGDPRSPETNRFVDFFFDDGMMFDEVILSSTRNSFEFDNIAIGLLDDGGPGAGPNVPEPASLLLLGAALLFLGAARRKQRGSAVALAAFLFATPALAGVHVTSIAGGGNPNGLSSTRAGVTTDDFNNTTTGVFFERGSGPSFTAPLDDTTNYLVVDPGHTAIGFAFGASNYFALYWGSIDDFNQISFFREGHTVARFSGNDIWNPANGATARDLNRFVEFFFDDGTTFDEVHLISPGVSFEIDNMAHGFIQAPRVPEPASLPLLGGVLVALAAVRYRLR